MGAWASRMHFFRLSRTFHQWYATAAFPGVVRCILGRAQGEGCVLRSNLASENTMKVIHRGQEHLVSFSSDEVALLLAPCFAGACSDLLPSSKSAKTRVRRFIGQVQECLLDTAQQEWLAKRGLGHQVA